MPHISLPPQVPGIVAPMMAYPETAVHLNGLAEALLRGPSSLTPAERESLEQPPTQNARAYDLYLRAREYQLRSIEENDDSVIGR